MKTIKEYKFSTLILITVLFFGCMHEDILERDEEDDQIELTFNYSVTGMYTVQTRSAPYLPEIMQSKISNVHAVVYEYDESIHDETVVYYQTLYDIAHNDNTGTGTFTLKLSKGLATGNKFTIDFISNILASNFDTYSIRVGMTREEVRAKITWGTTVAPSLSTSQTIGMWAYCGPIEITHAMNVPALSFLRSLARVDLGLDMDSNNFGLGLPNFTATANAQLYNLQSNSLRIPDPQYVQGDRVTNATINPGGYSQSGSSASFIVASLNGSNSGDHSAIGRVFPVETPAVNPNSGGLGPHIILIGEYTDSNGKVHSNQYYRIDFLDPADKITPIPILRNHHYRINIRSINGLGALSLNNAQNGAASNSAGGPVEAEMVVYDDSGKINYIIWNEDSYLGISMPEAATIPLNGGDIKIYAITNNIYNPTSVTINTSASPSSGVTRNPGTFTLRDQLVVCTITLTKQTAPRTVTITFTAPGTPLSIPVVIQQQD